MTDRIAEIEARLDRKREPCQDIYFDSWNWDQKKFHLHAEEDVAYLLAEVRRLRRQIEKANDDEHLRQSVMRQLEKNCTDAETGFLFQINRSENAEALALELAEALNACRRNPSGSAEDHSAIADKIAKMALADCRLAKLREKKCQIS